MILSALAAAIQSGPQSSSLLRPPLKCVAFPVFERTRKQLYMKCSTLHNINLCWSSHQVMTFKNKCCSEISWIRTCSYLWLHIWLQVFEQVTILFSDVVGFTRICSQITPMSVVSMLNTMYTKFDKLTEKHKVYKVTMFCHIYILKVLKVLLPSLSVYK